MLNPVPFIDHTLLKSTATPEQIELLCEEAVEFGFAAVCLPPFYVRKASDLLYGSSVQVATVVGFPLGYEASAVKKFQTQHALAAGATEIDMVINLAAAKAGDMALVEKDIAAVVTAGEEAAVKVIIECCEFDDAMKKALAETVIAAGADYVKTSTGFAGGGATLEDVRLLSRSLAGRAKIKAAGGIRDLDCCLGMIEAGADRIGTSAGVEIARQWLQGVAE
jgi:deoxyribose-phosphate aldolase